MKYRDDMTFSELVDWAAGHILQELLKGNFRGAISHVIVTAMEWRAEQER